MANNDVTDSPRVGATGDDPPIVSVSRRVRDQRAIDLAGRLLMTGMVLERQVKTLVKARVRT
jgi:hypothetical protein